MVQVAVGSAATKRRSAKSSLVWGSLQFGRALHQPIATRPCACKSPADRRSQSDAGWPACSRTLTPLLPPWSPPTHPQGLQTLPDLYQALPALPHTTPPNPLSSRPSSPFTLHRPLGPIRLGGRGWTVRQYACLGCSVAWSTSQASPDGWLAVWPTGCAPLFSPGDRPGAVRSLSANAQCS